LDDDDEDVHVGQKISFTVTQGISDKLTSTQNGISSATQTTSGQSWKATLTVLAAKDGSATSVQLDIDPESFDTSKGTGQDAVKTRCPYAGKSITLTSQPDGSVKADFTDSNTAVNESTTPPVKNVEVYDHILHTQVLPGAGMGAATAP
jgi:hypothetical protein